MCNLCIEYENSQNFTLGNFFGEGHFKAKLTKPLELTEMKKKSNRIAQPTYALAHCMLSCLAFTAAAGTHQLLLSWVVVYLGVHVQGS